MQLGPSRVLGNLELCLPVAHPASNQIANLNFSRSQADLLVRKRSCVGKQLSSGLDHFRSITVNIRDLELPKTFRVNRGGKKALRTVALGSRLQVSMRPVYGRVA